MVLAEQKIPATLLFLASAGILLGIPADAAAIQQHVHDEGIIVHQIGHLFFLLSMVVLVLSIAGKGLGRLKGWRCIQVSCLFFILWNIGTITAHFLDNQIDIVSMEIVSFNQLRLTSISGGLPVEGIYYFLKMDHLLCVPAMLFLYLGVSALAGKNPQEPSTEDKP